jgi:integrase
MSKSKRNRPSDKPAKPYPDFPLFPHATRRWAKKIRGRLCYFGKWDDPQAALDKYLEQKDDLYAGRRPREDKEGFTIADLCDHFLNWKDQLVRSGELSSRTRLDCGNTTDLIIAHFGKTRLVSDVRMEDFAALRDKLAKKWGPVRLGNVVQQVRSVFKFAFDAEHINTPIRFGPGFKKPSKKTLRMERARKGKKLFRKEEILRMLDAAGEQLRAMILLAINAGLGNADCSNLRLSNLDLDKGWLDFPRPKTGVERRAPLWPETVDAIRRALEMKREPKDPAEKDRVFITKYGLPWGKDIADSPVTKETRKLLDVLGINGSRNFYTLRHTFRTVADNSKDQPAIDHIMGHESPHMSSQYREGISDDRLLAVTEYVRQWLFGGPTEGEEPDVVKLPEAKAN